MNHLSAETSPYLLQHAHNPVHWYAWKPEAFEKARLEQKPILVSIGYSTCHWCHVMERESFENEDIAAFMNERFINIKVDREERPDVDAIYMDACQVLTGSGGWPLNCFLTPDGKPFYAGTYFPPRPAHNRPSWLQLLQHIANVWESQRTVALEQAERLMGHIAHTDKSLFKPLVAQPDSEAAVEPGAFSREALATLFHNMQQQFDREEGGFGGAPKFPSTMALVFLMQFHYVSGNSDALQHALFSLQQMISGGIYDQLGGGFARYSTDREWLAPHFEKMLYDNALLVTVLSDAYKISGQFIFRETIEETLAYIDREMTHPDGGFYSAQDADSEGVEGKFFVWHKAEIDAILGEHAELFNAFYDVVEAGNWEGHTILWRLESFETFAEKIGMPAENLKAILQSCREKLFAVREQRVKPGLDDKILLGWNALMCSAYAHAYSALGHEAYRQAALRNINFILAHFEDGAGLRHVWKDGKAQYAAMLDDYAFLIDALIEVWQISFHVRYLQLAEKYTEQVLSYFMDADTGVFYYTAADQTDIILRKKDLYDNATPSGNSTMALNLQKLAILLDRPDWREQAGRLLAGMKETTVRFPLSFERWASGMLQHSFPTMEIAIVGKNALEKAAAIRREYRPNTVMAAAESESDHVPLLAGKPGADDALIYVCQNFVCRQAVVTLEDFQSIAAERNLSF